MNHDPCTFLLHLNSRYYFLGKSLLVLLNTLSFSAKVSDPRLSFLAVPEMLLVIHTFE